MELNLIKQATFGDTVSDEIVAKLGEVREQLINKEIAVFEGPIYAQDGSVMFEDGYRPTIDVQGLGLGALLLAVLSGLIWYLLWVNGSPFAELARKTHENLTLLIELYLLGHGGMALLHFFVWQRKSGREAKTQERSDS